MADRRADCVHPLVGARGVVLCFIGSFDYLASLGAGIFRGISASLFSRLLLERSVQKFGV